jgi:hypothetical protein
LEGLIWIGFALHYAMGRAGTKCRELVRAEDRTGQAEVRAQRRASSLVLLNIHVNGIRAVVTDGRLVCHDDVAVPGKFSSWMAMSFMTFLALIHQLLVATARSHFKVERNPDVSIDYRYHKRTRDSVIDLKEF